MMKSAVFILLLTLVFSCDLVKNTLPLIDQEPKLIKEVPNGQKFIIGDPSDPKGSYLYIVNVKGTAREMGKAYGQLMVDEM